MMDDWNIALLSMRCAVLSLLLLKSEGNNGICSIQEVVSKTRNVQVYRTYIENYRDYTRGWCNGRYMRYCDRQRLAGSYATEEQIYTQMATKDVCCSGYKEVGSTVCEGCTPRCEPVCDLPCLHATCTMPNHCECDAGYSKQSGTENICEPVCSEPCAHGYCSAPETCTCDPGYQLDPAHQHSCVPVCSMSCINGNCSAPDVCTCLAGYHKVTEDPHKCHAHCSRPCQNAVCTKPDVCSCLLGYTKDNDNSNICSPVCGKDCVNGLCTGPNECTCFNGFTVVGEYHNCEPVCSYCLNSFCSAPEVCTCFKGYEIDVNDSSVCLPVCSPECVYSNCSAPDTCECFSGYEETDNPSVCKPYCSDGCGNGVCTEPEVCTCLWGFQSEGNTSNCSLSSSQNHNCTFVNKLLGHDFDRSCFTIIGEIPLQELSSCEILQELLVEFNNVTFQFNCNKVVHLDRTENALTLELVCDVTINDDESDSHTSSNEEVYSTDVFGTTLAYTEESLPTDQSTFDGLYFSNGPSEYSFSSPHPSIGDTFSEDKSVSPPVDVDILPTTSEAYLGVRRTSQQLDMDFTGKEFKIISNNVIENRMDVSLTDFSLSLNITLQFLSVTIQKQLTQEYFVDNHRNASLDENWCICHKTKTWQLCAYEDIQLVLCPCQYTSDGARLTDNSSSLITLKTVAVSAMAVFLVGLVVMYVSFKLKSFGAYYTF